MKWTSVEFMPPPNGIFVHTKISDEQGERNIQKLKRQNNLYYSQDGDYVYYQPTHWAFLEQCEWSDEKTWKTTMGL